jgi:drug/metabolite transporter (DMT)-like permease
MNSHHAHRKLGTALALLYVFLWASAFVPSRVLSTSGPPLWTLVVRFGFAGGLLLLGTWAAGIPLPTRRGQWLQLALLGLTGNALYLGFNYTALKHLSSGMGAIIASTNPLLLALIAPRLLGEPITPRKLAGMLLGFSGVVISMHARAGTQTARPQDVLLALAGVSAGVASTVIFKRMKDAPHPVMVNAVQLASAGVLLVPGALFVEGAPRVSFPAPVVVSLVWLVLVMSIGASLLWFWLLSHGDASRVSAFYFLTPVFGLLLGALLLGERLTALDGVGLAVIAVGLLLVTRDPVPTPPPTAPINSRARARR